MHTEAEQDGHMKVALYRHSASIGFDLDLELQIVSC